MKINIRGDKIKVTPAIKSHIETKIAKLERYFDNPEEVDVNIIVRVKGLEQIIEITVPTSKFTLRAEEKHSDLYASVDLVVDKLERQIRKNKTRLTKYKHEEVNFNLDYEVNNIPEESDSSEFKIIKRKYLESKPMDEEEAILQMELLNHDFFVFKNIDEDCVSVIYLRKDGDYGIINIK